MKRIIELARYSIFLVIAFVFLLFFYTMNHWAQHFSVLADSLIQGRLDVIHPLLNNTDYVLNHGRYYWPLGPLPAVLLIPLKMIFGMGTNQILLLVIFVTLFIFYSFLFAGNFLKLRQDIPYFVGLLLFGSIYSGLIYDSSSYYLAHIMTSVFLFMLIYEFINKKRFLVMGILITLLISTRITSITFIIPILISLAISGISAINKLIKLINLLLPIITVIILLGFYNYFRFGSFFESGYAISIIPDILTPYRLKGLFSLSHIPMNIYWYFLSVPTLFYNSRGYLTFPYLVFNRWGLSIFIVAPVFIYTLKTFKYKDIFIRYLWIAIFASLGILLMYYGTGYQTFGPRYTADFFPMVYLLLLIYFKDKPLSEFQKNFILLSCIFNTYLIYSTNFYIH